MNIKNLKNLRNFCKTRGFKIFLANNLRLARSLYFDGVYLPSFNNERVLKENLKKNFIILGSAHNIKEIKIKPVKEDEISARTNKSALIILYQG